MKKDISSNEIIYMIAIFMMPIVTFIGVTKLQTDIINISDVIKIGASDYNTLFLGDMILFITCWVALFVSYVLYRNNIKLAQCLIFIGSIVYLIYNINLAINSYGSISSIINPLIVLTTSLYALCKPAKSDLVVDAPVKVDKKVEEAPIEVIEEVSVEEIIKKEDAPKGDDIVSEIKEEKTKNTKNNPPKKKNNKKKNNQKKQDTKSDK